ncbi:MAG: hypothetical protein HYX84_03355 [Chloroflexi bacterium]|nr:hypothetical protein [Chloroflexota bacterium]
MSWLPSPTRLIVLLKSIEKEENPLQDATELFWLFWMNSLSPEDFQDRVLFWINKHLEDSPKGGGFIDADVRDVILQGPERVAEIILARLNALCEMRRVPYIPDKISDPKSLYVSTLLESSRLIRLLRTERYSETTREVLDMALNALVRLGRAKIIGQDPQWPKEYSIFASAIGEFLYVCQFLIQKADGEYEKSIQSLAGGIASYIMTDVNISDFNQTKSRITEPALSAFMNRVTSCHRELSPLSIYDLDYQLPVDCFEALRKGERILDPKNIAAVCGLLAMVYSNSPTVDEDDNEVKDAEGENWNVIAFWHHASGLLEGRLQPSDLRELLNEREDSASEKRLRTYFFGDEAWNKLPERVRSSLVSADRDWFSGTVARKEAVFNELRIATEELLSTGLWKPVEQWIPNQKKGDNDTKWFTDRRHELSQNGSMPTLLDFERLCRLNITNAFLKERGTPGDKRDWFCKHLPKSLYHLRRARNRAEHESVDKWSRQDFGNFYDEFMGIGRPGILPELCRILLFQNR